ncbi:MAG: LexA family transcriptional regulator [Gammaproteobacteria bacterium]|nr:LexA family transcriptional regulator [Gammaproteobacteria bacterium]
MRIEETDTTMHEEKNQECLSDRLNYAIEATGVSKADLARAVGIKPQTIQYLCTTKAESSKFTFELAIALGINFAWLAAGKGEMLTPKKPDTHLQAIAKMVPFLSIAQIKALAIEPGAHEHLKFEAFIEVSTAVSKNTFAYILNDQSMWPRFIQGTILILDPTRLPGEGDFILVYLQSIDDVIFREVSTLDDKKVLLPFNKGIYKEVELKDTDVILGTLVEARWRAE